MFLTELFLLADEMDPAAATNGYQRQGDGR